MIRLHQVSGAPQTKIGSLRCEMINTPPTWLPHHNTQVGSQDLWIGLLGELGGEGLTNCEQLADHPEQNILVMKAKVSAYMW